MKPRRLTVSTLHRQGHRLSPESAVPHLRLTGAWLAQAGFARGARVIVAIAAGVLTLTQEVAP